MKIEESAYKDDFLIKLEEPFGNFYVFTHFVVGEIKEGVHFDWDKASIVIERIYDFFGSREIKVAYISNRIYSYSVTAQDWLEFYRQRNTLTCFAVVVYSKIGWMNVAMEKIFFKSKLKKFNNLSKAIKWTEKMKKKPQE